MNTYTIGDLVRLTGTFTDLSGNLSDPTTSSLVVKSPDGTVTTYPSLVHPSTGIYYFDLPITGSGVYYYRYAGTGAVVAAGETQFQVSESVVLSE